MDLIDGEALVLSLPDSSFIPLEVRSRLRIVLDREGIKLVAPVPFQVLPWAQVLCLEDPMDAVRRIENSVGLVPTEGAQPNAAARAYAIIARILAVRVNDAQGWHVRALHPSLLGVDSWGPTEIPELSTLTDYLLKVFEFELLRGMTPQQYPAWILYSGFNVIAAFDEHGGLHLPGATFKVGEIYVNTGCNLHATAMMIDSAINC